MKEKQYASGSVKRTDNRIVCVVVLYHKGLEDCEVYRTLIKENLQDLDCLLVFDNSSEARSATVTLPNGIFRYVSNGCNLGLSANYNNAARYAADNGFRWLLLLDEDTSFPPQALKVYRNALKAHPAEGLFVPLHRISNGKLLSPSRPFKGLADHVPPGIHSLRDYDVINSGLLVSVDEFLAVGGYKAEVNLDFSDYQFIERVRTLRQTVVVLDMECLQDFSNDVKDRQKLLRRFDLYCRNAVHFEALSSRSRHKVNYLVAKHTLMMSLRCRSLRPFKVLAGAIKNKRKGRRTGEY